MKQTTKYLLGIAAAYALVMGASGVFARGGFGPGWGGHHGMQGLGGRYHPSKEWSIARKA